MKMSLSSWRGGRVYASALMGAAAIQIGMVVTATFIVAGFSSAPSQAAAPLAQDNANTYPPIYPWAIDVDGDGRQDLANPTGHIVRGEDTYGAGYFGASRAGGQRRHHGVDYVSEPGEIVRAPISGTVRRIGYAYRGDERYSFVELSGEKKRTARVLYVGAQVAVGEYVQAGDPIGQAQDLRARYPGGITNHVHVELASAQGVRLDAAGILPSGAPSPSTPHDDWSSS